MMPQLVLVTGGAGFVGSHLTSALVKRGFRVRVLDNLSRGRIEYIERFIQDGSVEFIDGDIRYPDTVTKCMKDVDYVFHEAAVCINRSLQYPQESLDINLYGSYNVFKIALDHGVKKVIFASSASVYGEPQQIPISEDHPLNPLTPYCVSKISCEYLLRFLARQGLKYFILRYFNIYGPRQPTDAYYTSVILLFIKNLLHGKPPVILGEGSQTMDFVHVDDVVQANLLAMKSPVTNEVVNIGSATQTSILDLAKMLINIMGADVEPIFQKREILVKKRQADISKARKILGYTPTKDLATGLKELIEDIKKYPEYY